MESYNLGELFISGAKHKLIQFLNDLLGGIILSSYWICLIGGMIGLILYVFGYKKGKNYPLISIAIYLIINIIGRALLNV